PARASRSAREGARRRGPAAAEDIRSEAEGVLRMTDWSGARLRNSMPAKSTESDRRTNDRHAIELKVEYKRLNTFFADYTKNISKGGTFIRTDKPLSIGTEFLFKLFVPQLQ